MKRLAVAITAALIATPSALARSSDVLASGDLRRGRLLDHRQAAPRQGSPGRLEPERSAARRRRRRRRRASRRRPGRPQPGAARAGLSRGPTGLRRPSARVRALRLDPQGRRGRHRRAPPRPRPQPCLVARRSKDRVRQRPGRRRPVDDPAAGGGLQRLTSSPGNETDPAWSPDARRIAYATDETGAAEIALLDLATKKRAPLTADQATVIRWSPDARRVAYVSSRDAVDAVWSTPRGGAPRRVALGPAERPRWRPSRTSSSSFPISTSSLRATSRSNHGRHRPGSPRRPTTSASGR